MSQPEPSHYPSLIRFWERRADLVLGFLLSIAVFIVFGKAWRAGLVSDWTGLAWRIENSRGAIDIWNSFGFPSNQQLLNLLLYGIYKAFKNDPFLWYLLFSAVHLLNGLLFYQVLKSLFSAFSLPKDALLIGLCTAIFLFNPYQNEAVVWKACFNWLSSSSCILYGLWAFLRWKKAGSNAFLWWVHLSFLAGLFLLEQTFVFPLFTGLLFWALPAKETPFAERSMAYLKLIALPQVFLLGGYLLLNQFTLGAWVGHYGTDIHLAVDPESIAVTLVQYLAKIFAFAHFTVSDKLGFYADISQSRVWIPIVLAGSILLALSLVFWRKYPPAIRVGVLLFVLGLVALLPVANLYFAHILYIENDRYSYLPSGFLLTSLPVLLTFLNRYLAKGVGLIYLSVGLYYLFFTLGIWNDNAKMLYALTENYSWGEEEQVYVLNLADNVQGCRLFRDYDSVSGLKDHLLYTAGKPVAGEIHGVLYYNALSPLDGVRVTAVSDSTLQVNFKQDGNWWWLHGVGATPYETEAFRVQLNAWDYHFIRKDLPPGSRVIYQDGLEWKEWEWETTGDPKYD